MVSKAAGYAPPSAIARALVSLVLLGGFYVVLVGVAAALFALPVSIVWLRGNIDPYIGVGFVLCWVPAGLLIASVFRTRRPGFIPPTRKLEPKEAPALFATVEELAKRAGTAPPSEVYLVPLPDLAVTEVGSVSRPRRVMILGAPLLGLLTVDELRSAIAHELGHFLGGDTRLTTFSVQTHSLFASVLGTVERNPFRIGAHAASVEGALGIAEVLGRVLVAAYSRLYLRVTLPIDRRQELAADALSAKIVGTRIAVRTLERVHVDAPLYLHYLQKEVGYAITQGAMPTDLVPGFLRLRERLLARQDGREFESSIRTQKTDPYDTHPALADRVRAIEGGPSVDADEDERSASSLFVDRVALDAWLVDSTRARMIAAVLAGAGTVGDVRELPWSRIPSEVYTPAAREEARRLAQKLFPLMPDATTLSAMFAAVWRHLARGNTRELALKLDPQLSYLQPGEIEQQSSALIGGILAVLFQGALVEHGAVAEESFGEATLVLRLGDERLEPARMVLRILDDPTVNSAEMERWVERLGGPVPLADGVRLSP
jgi:Zn-dependent protease with chaperone function